MALKNLNIDLKDARGEAITNEKGNQLTARKAIVQALERINLPHFTPEQKNNFWEFAVRIEKSDGEPDFIPEDLAKIKEVVGLFWQPFIVGPVFVLLNS